jgi:hypothetical protein
MKYKFHSTIKNIERKSRILRAWKSGPNKEDVKTEKEDMGWYLLLEGSWEYLYIGVDDPIGWSIGDEVVVTIEKGKS